MRIQKRRCSKQEKCIDIQKSPINKQKKHAETFITAYQSARPAAASVRLQVDALQLFMNRSCNKNKTIETYIRTAMM
jgi:hypothetical protein